MCMHKETLFHLQIGVMTLEIHLQMLPENILQVLETHTPFLSLYESNTYFRALKICDITPWGKDIDQDMDIHMTDEWGNDTDRYTFGLFGFHDYGVLIMDL